MPERKLAEFLTASVSPQSASSVAACRFGAELARISDGEVARAERVVIKLRGPMPEDRPPELLLVDDDDTQITLYERSLAPFFEVTASRSGPDALELLGAKSFDILLTDHLMPEM